MWCALCMTSQDEWCNKWEGKEIKGENEHIRLVLHKVFWLFGSLSLIDTRLSREKGNELYYKHCVCILQQKRGKKWVLYCVIFEARKEWIWWRSCGCSYFFLLCLHYALDEYAMDVGLSDGISMFPYILECSLEKVYPCSFASVGIPTAKSSNDYTRRSGYYFPSLLSPVKWS